MKQRSFSEHVGCRKKGGRERSLIMRPRMKEENEWSFLDACDGLHPKLMSCKQYGRRTSMSPGGTFPQAETCWKAFFLHVS